MPGQGRLGQRTLGRGSTGGSEWEKHPLGLGRSCGRAERCGAGLGCAPVSAPSWQWAPERERWRAGGQAHPELLSTSPVLKPPGARCLGRAMVSCWGTLVEVLECPSPQSPHTLPEKPRGLAQEVVREGRGTLGDVHHC